MGLLRSIGIVVAVSAITWVGMYLWFPVSIFDTKTLGSTITTIAAGDTLSASRSVINTNFSNLNTDKFELSDWYATTSANQLTDIGNQTSFSITFASTTALDAATYLKVGSNGSTIAELKATTCNFLGMDVSHAATSTKPYDCAITGLASGDVVLAQLATSSPNAGQTDIGWFMRSCHASTTTAYITCDITNFTGGAATPSVTAVGSSTNVWYLDN